MILTNLKALSLICSETQHLHRLVNMGLDCHSLQLVLHVRNKDRENTIKEAQAKPIYGIFQIIWAFLFILIKETQSLENFPLLRDTIFHCNCLFFSRNLLEYFLVVYHRARASECEDHIPVQEQETVLHGFIILQCQSALKLLERSSAITSIIQLL